MDFDQTQAIQLSFEDETDEEAGISSKTQISSLRVLQYKDLPEKVYPIYEGETIIGRDESCDISIPIKALSKQHACIEIKGDSHLVYDKNSLNKTRRGKLYLVPEVRYELKANHTITFADLACVYVMKPKKEDLSGSETGSESMLDNNSNSKTNVQPMLIEDDDDDDSNASSDILQPTQCYEQTLLIKQGKSTLSFEVESEEEYIHTENNKNKITVKETPVNNKKQSGKGTFTLLESASETDDERDAPVATLVFSEDGKCGEEDILLNAPTQACIMESETDDDDDDMSKNSDLLNAATQANPGTLIIESIDVDEDDDEPTIDLNAPTQAYHSVSDNDDTDIDNPEPTLAYNMDNDKSSSRHSTKTSKSKLPKTVPATVPYEMGADISGVAETQTFLLDKDEELLSPIPNSKPNMSSPEKNSNITAAKMSDVNSDALVPQKDNVLVEDGESEERDLSHLFVMPTLACDMNEDIPEESSRGKTTESETNTNGEGSTQSLEKDSKQLMETSSCTDETTQLIEAEIKGTTKQTDEESTLALDATVPLNNTNKSVATSDSEATQPLSETIPFKDAGATLGVQDDTVPVSFSDQTQLIQGTTDFDVSDFEDATQAYVDDAATLTTDGMATMHVDDKQAMFDEPTQAYGASPRQPIKKKGKRSKLVKKRAITDDTKIAEEECLIEEPTQLYGLSPVKSAHMSNISGSDDVSPLKLVSDDSRLVEDETRPSVAPVDIPTQPYVISPARSSRKRKILTLSDNEVSDSKPAPKSVSKGRKKLEAMKKKSEIIKTDSKDDNKIMDSESSNDTLPVEDIEFIPDSESPEDDKPPLIPIPSRSPHKSALASPEKRSPSPSPKRVAFVGIIESTPEDDLEEHGKKSPKSKILAAVTTSSRGRVRTRRSLINTQDKPETKAKRLKTLPIKTNKIIDKQQEKTTTKGGKSLVSTTTIDMQDNDDLPVDLTDDKKAIRGRRKAKSVKVDENSIKEKEKETTDRRKINSSHRIIVDDDDPGVESKINETVSGKPGRKCRIVKDVDQKDESDVIKKQVEKAQSPTSRRGKRTTSEIEGNKSHEEETVVKPLGKGKRKETANKNVKKDIIEQTDKILENNSVSKRKATRLSTVATEIVVETNKNTKKCGETKDVPVIVVTIPTETKLRRGRQTAEIEEFNVSLESKDNVSQKRSRRNTGQDSKNKPTNTRTSRAGSKTVSEKQSNSNTESLEDFEDKTHTTSSRSKCKIVSKIVETKRKKTSDKCETTPPFEIVNEEMEESKNNSDGCDKTDTKVKNGRTVRTSKAEITSSEETVQSSVSNSQSEKNLQSIATVNRSKRRTSKRQHGQVDDSKEVEAPATDCKVSKHGGNDSPSTPSRNKPIFQMCTSPSLRRKSFGMKPKVMFTGVVDEQGEKMVKDLGGTLANSIWECTHLVTDKIRRTVKLLGGISLGIHIVNRHWLENCKQAGMFLDSSKFIVSDKTSEKQYKFSLSQSIDSATHHPMLQGYKVHVTKSVKPDPVTMKEILECAGAQYLKTIPKKKEAGLVIISCEEDKQICHSAINTEIDVVSSEFILTGILRQKVEIESFRLFCDMKPAAKTKSRKK